jgi:ribosomal protein S13
MQNEKISFEKKKGTMEYFIKMGADVNVKVFGKTILCWAKELGDEKVVQYVEENNGIEEVISKEVADNLGKEFWDENGELKSVKVIKDLVMCGANLGGRNEDNNQIWKDLSEDEIKEVVKILPKGYVIDGDVDLNNRELTELPDFSKIKVNRGFYCFSNQLTSLRGAPREVKGNFECYRNKLTTLENGPISVGGDFICSYNQLKTLKGVPSVVGGSFKCFNNQLTSLKEAPREVGGDFRCDKNQLLSLKGKPEKIGGEFIVEKEVLKKITPLKKLLDKIWDGRE